MMKYLTPIFLTFLLLSGCLALAQTETYLSANGTDPETTRGESRLLRYQREDFPVEVYIPPTSWTGTGEEVGTTVQRAFRAWADAAPDIVSFTFVDAPGEEVLVVDWESLDENLAGSYRYSFSVLPSGLYDYRLAPGRARAGSLWAQPLRGRRAEHRTKW